MDDEEQLRWNEQRFAEFTAFGFTGAELLEKYPWLKKYPLLQRLRKLPRLVAQEIKIEILERICDEYVQGPDRIAEGRE